MSAVVAAFLALAAGLGTAGASLAAMGANGYPERPITVIVPYAAGGSSDVLARLLGERLSQSLGQQILVDNRAGAGSRIGIEVAAKSAPDGYTLLLADMPHTIIPAVQKGVHYHPVHDFTAIGLIGTAPMFLFVTPALKAETVPELVALARAEPEKITIASGGIGSTTHLTAELFQAEARIKLVHVPFRGAGPAMNDLVAGHVQSGFTTLMWAWRSVCTGQGAQAAQRGSTIRSPSRRGLAVEILDAENGRVGRHIPVEVGPADHLAADDANGRALGEGADRGRYPRGGSNIDAAGNECLDGFRGRPERRGCQGRGHAS